MITKHLAIFPEDYVEIKQGEYRNLKRSDPKNVNSYTARVGFKFFKLKDDFDIYLDLTKFNSQDAINSNVNGAELSLNNLGKINPQHPDKNQELNHVIEVFKEKLKIVEREINSLNNQFEELKYSIKKTDKELMNL